MAENFDDIFRLACRRKTWFGFSTWTTLFQFDPAQAKAVEEWAMGIQRLEVNVEWRIENRGGRPQKGYFGF